MAYILKAPSISKLAPGNMYYSEGRWVKEEKNAQVFKLKKDATAAAKEENNSASLVSDVEVVKVDK